MLSIIEVHQPVKITVYWVVHSKKYWYNEDVASSLEFGEMGTLPHQRDKDSNIWVQWIDEPSANKHNIVSIARKSYPLAGSPIHWWRGSIWWYIYGGMQIAEHISNVSYQTSKVNNKNMLSRPRILHGYRMGKSRSVSVPENLLPWLILQCDLYLYFDTQNHCRAQILNCQRFQTLPAYIHN